MKTNVLHSSLSVALLALCCCQAKAQIYDTNGDYVQTFAGSGFSGYVDGVEQQTMFNYPSKVAADSFGNLFVLQVLKPLQCEWAHPSFEKVTALAGTQPEEHECGFRRFRGRSPPH